MIGYIEQISTPIYNLLVGGLNDSCGVELFEVYEKYGPKACSIFHTNDPVSVAEKFYSFQNIFSTLLGISCFLKTIGRLV